MISGRLGYPKEKEFLYSDDDLVSPKYLEKTKVKTNKSSIGLAAITLLIMAGFDMVTPVEAKTYYTLYDVRYEHSEIPSNLQPYINKVEYDIPSSTVSGYGYGVRLYLYDSSKWVLTGSQGATIIPQITSYVMSRPEWRGDRSFNSVNMEIMLHVQAATYWPARINPTHIEYFYSDLKWWESYRNV